MHKQERQIAEDFSQQIDDVLAGKDAPADDALLSLAAEIASAPAIRPSPTFARKLRQRLLSSQPSRPIRSTWRWAAGTTVLTAVIAVLLILVWNPWSPPSAQEVLARAADAAIPLQPGQIEHIVLRATISWPEIHSGEVLTQQWKQIEEMPDGNLSIEVVNLYYDPDDTDLENLISASYLATPSTTCWLSFEEQQPFPSHDTDENGCISRDLSYLAGPHLAWDSVGSPQEWIDLLEQSDMEMDRKAYKDRLDGRPVYRLEGNRECWAITNDEKIDYACNMTLYIDRETYAIVGGASEPASKSGPGISSSHTVVSYEVLAPEELDFDPFAWPPQQ